MFVKDNQINEIIEEDEEADFSERSYRSRRPPKRERFVPTIEVNEPGSGCKLLVVNHSQRPSLNPLNAYANHTVEQSDFVIDNSPGLHVAKVNSIKLQTQR